MNSSILITGASSGIGRALAHEMAQRGYRLALTARRKSLLDETAADIRSKYKVPAVVTRELDVTDDAAVARVVPEAGDALGGLDIVFANAGVGLGEKVGQGEFDKARRTVEVNMIGAMATVDAAVAYFLAHGGGHVVGTSSVAAYRGMPRASAYSASKAGLAVYLEALRAECYRKNIHVTVLYPGYIDTPLNSMLSNRPFLIPVEKGAAIMARLIEKKVRSARVPAYPWAVLAPLLKMLPVSIVSRM